MNAGMPCGLICVVVLASLAVWVSSAGARPYDFNGDGYGDLAVVVRGEGPLPHGDAGAVQVIFGSRRGLTARGDQNLPVLAPGTVPPADADPFVQSRLVVGSGDFNGDGFADLVVGAPDREVDGAHGAGAVAISYGSRRGLEPVPRQALAAGHGLPGAPTARAGLGTALAGGDFDRDGYGDLAIGVPGQSVSGHGGAGAVLVIPGSAGGLLAGQSRLWTQDTPGIADAADLFLIYENPFSERFGSTLAAGDANGDRFVDLAIGVPGETIVVGQRLNDAAYAAGAVHVLLGRRTGLSARGDQFWTQASPGVADRPEGQTDVDAEPVGGDAMGGALTFGDFDRDGRDDLAIGVPNEVIRDCPDEPPCADGAVHVLRGARRGLTARGSRFLHPLRRGVPGSVLLDGSGYTDGASAHELAAGDLDGDGAAELAVGAPSATVPPARHYGGQRGEGAVVVFHGGRRGLRAGRSRMLAQSSRGVAGAAEPWDAFGNSVVVRNLGAGRAADLVIGAPFEDVDAARDAGSVTVCYGAPRGVAAAASHEWHQNVPGVRGRAETMDWFGDL